MYPSSKSAMATMIARTVLTKCPAQHDSAHLFNSGLSLLFKELMLSNAHAQGGEEPFENVSLFFSNSIEF